MGTQMNYYKKRWSLKWNDAFVKKKLREGRERGREGGMERERDIKGKMETPWVYYVV